MYYSIITLPDARRDKIYDNCIRICDNHIGYTERYIIREDIMLAIRKYKGFRLDASNMTKFSGFVAGECKYEIVTTGTPGDVTPANVYAVEIKESMYTSIVQELPISIEHRNTFISIPYIGCIITFISNEKNSCGNIVVISIRDYFDTGYYEHTLKYLRKLGFCECDVLDPTYVPTSESIVDSAVRYIRMKIDAGPILTDHLI